MDGPNATLALVPVDTKTTDKVPGANLSSEEEKQTEPAVARMMFVRDKKTGILRGKVKEVAKKKQPPAEVRSLYAGSVGGGDSARSSSEPRPITERDKKEGEKLETPSLSSNPTPQLRLPFKRGI